MRAPTSRRRLGRWTSLAYVVACAGCSTGAAPPGAATPASSALVPVLSIRELMTHVIDPTADWIFDAAVVDISHSGTTTTTPVSDEDWVKVERGLLLLAESSNLLKMQRPVAPAGGAAEPVEPGKPAPELPPAEIAAKIDADRARWNQHADDLRAAALTGMTLVRQRNPEALFKVGGDLDNACEACHLEYWYPGDKPAVMRDRNAVATTPSPK